MSKIKLGIHIGFWIAGLITLANGLSRIITWQAPLYGFAAILVSGYAVAVGALMAYVSWQYAYFANEEEK